jgi:hypothetical protein
MLNKITTVLIAVVFAAIMTWCFFSPFLAPKLYFRRPLGSSFLKLVGLEFPTYYVARVDLSEMLPLLRQVI